jgi:lipoyl-dependent peroxiredoxin
MAYQPLYTAVATATGGRDGHVETDDGLLKFDLSIPKEMGGPGKAGATNPEQLFASGYAGCFAGAIGFVAGQEHKKLSSVGVTSHVTFGKEDSGAFQLAVELHCQLPDLSKDDAEKLVEKAHQVCPYSRATRNNIEVKLIVD